MIFKMDILELNDKCKWKIIFRMGVLELNDKCK